MLSELKAQTGTVQVPAVHGEALNGAVVDLPAALKGKVAVLMVSFSQGSREQMTAWGRRLAGDYRDSNEVSYYELPVLEAVPKLLRGIVVGKIRDGVPDRARPRFVPVFDHEDAWKSVTGYKESDQTYVLLVDSTGTVRWRTQGAASDEAYAQMKQHIAALHPGS
jgi:hypothetical protein